MTRYWMLVLLAGVLLGCGRRTCRMEHPESPTGRYREQIAVAQRVLDQKENWSDRAEWEVVESAAGWDVIAWRVEHPERTGPNRYLPWGYSIIELDRRMTPIGYRNKG